MWVLTAVTAHGWLLRVSTKSFLSHYVVPLPSFFDILFSLELRDARVLYRDLAICSRSAFSLSLSIQEHPGKTSLLRYLK